MIPKYLYHYTSTETLKAIITSGNIRFKRLDKLNDPYEGIVKINDNYIEFRKKAFSSLLETESGFYPVENVSPIDYEGVHTQTGKPITINSVYGPIKIEYVDDISKIYEKVTSSDYIRNNFKEFACGVDFKELGIRKLKYWNGENEWRYIIWPFSFIGKYKSGSLDNFEVEAQKEYIDVPYERSIEEILLGPGIRDSQKNELKAWLKSKNISTPLLDSYIKINI